MVTMVLCSISCTSVAIANNLGNNIDSKTNIKNNQEKMKPILLSSGWCSTYFIRVTPPKEQSIVGNNRKEKKERGHSRKLKGATLGKIFNRKDLEIAKKWENRPETKLKASKQCRAQRLRDDYSRVWMEFGTKKHGKFNTNKHASKSQKITKQFWNRPPDMAYWLYKELRGW